MVIYLDDILIFSWTIEDYQKHVREIFRRLKQNELNI